MSRRVEVLTDVGLETDTEDIRRRLGAGGGLFRKLKKDSGEVEEALIRPREGDLVFARKLVTRKNASVLKDSNGQLQSHLTDIGETFEGVFQVQEGKFVPLRRHNRKR